MKCGTSSAKHGDFIVRLGLGLLFIWGGVEKFFEGFLGGVGLDNMAGFLSSVGFGFLGDTGVYVLGIVLALVELAAGIMLISNIYKKQAYGVLSVIILMSLFLVYVPKGDWMNGMIHFALFTTLLGLALQSTCCKKN